MSCAKMWVLWDFDEFGKYFQYYRYKVIELKRVLLNKFNKLQIWWGKNFFVDSEKGWILPFFQTIWSDNIFFSASKMMRNNDFF